MKATWKGVVLAESNDTVVIESNHYFPPEAVHREYFAESATHTQCHWKGRASYYSIEVEGQSNPDAAWYYPDPSGAARHIKDHVAFWKGVEVTE